MANMILRLPNVKARTGLSRSTIYSLCAQGRFPKSVLLNFRAVGWIESEIEDWLSRRIEQSRGTATACSKTISCDKTHRLAAAPTVRA
jgi:prophage regulatory protein